ncbi:2-oxoacid:acceptor oxidoreductase subunit alpha [Romboutsia sedimentorum]|uniref:2-oxoacid:acceptor oxidoreductase subunit alpha n=1 Tax=Romboutsia sedimentorum TaxID=1368474 RepID=A0ABT7EDR9_9FIRM|nr:2-oxoacid:acceptor oxidoreductase subunit alpha [Romboutsia sedimentorum]MDK2565074.1 2-oxoacid:acceptor oxidoreductase subunit alpha [Romboutsia sedimentorum]MDK2587497.1 2-oxoacid:acceptor oxidoreductase subunit alpha [Romboutsia sedimentorum]
MGIKAKLLQGNEACVHGAIHAGMKFFAGYPITPSTEIAEISSLILPRVKGTFIQMEDEIASMSAIIGASIAGKKSMTATSGPGFSLKQEAIGYACITETPCVVVNVQRSGPSTGLPTSPSQGDLMQARWGTHGDHSLIVLSPTTVSDTYELTVKAFNFAEKYRTPVVLLLDEVIGHMREKVDLSALQELEILDRKKSNCKKEEFKPFEVTKDLVPNMEGIGDGFKFHVTGLVHDETGFPTNSTKEAQKLFTRLTEKIENNLEDILLYENYFTDDCEVLIVTFGCMVRCSKDAVDTMREKGVKVGLLAIKTVWPFPEEVVKKLSKKVNHIFVPEMNMGQMSLEIERVVKDNCPVIGINKYNGEIITPEEITSKIEEVIVYA